MIFKKTLVRLKMICHFNSQFKQNFFPYILYMILTVKSTKIHSLLQCFEILPNQKYLLFMNTFLHESTFCIHNSFCAGVAQIYMIFSSYLGDLQNNLYKQLDFIFRKLPSAERECNYFFFFLPNIIRQIALFYNLCYFLYSVPYRINTSPILDEY